jgi:hypothetical protein
MVRIHDTFVYVRIHDTFVLCICVSSASDGLKKIMR